MIIARITPGWAGALGQAYRLAGEHLALTPHVPGAHIWSCDTPPFPSGEGCEAALRGGLRVFELSVPLFTSTTATWRAATSQQSFPLAESD
jgi:hypothetical protein